MNPVEISLVEVCYAVILVNVGILTRYVFVDQQPACSAKLGIVAGNLVPVRADDNHDDGTLAVLGGSPPTSTPEVIEMCGHVPAVSRVAAQCRKGHRSASRGIQGARNADWRIPRRIRGTQGVVQHVAIRVQALAVLRKVMNGSTLKKRPRPGS